MEKEFVPYAEALELKELGFDEECFGHYQQEWHDDGMTELKPSLQMVISKQHQHAYQLCTTPTFSQAFRWFREKYKLLGTPQYFTGGFYCYTINDMKDTKKSNRLFTEFELYEEAELECLRKLIEIVKIVK
jgi:hypothetical protein